jgi:hypothetical protein
MQGGTGEGRGCPMLRFSKCSGWVPLLLKQETFDQGRLCLPLSDDATGEISCGLGFFEGQRGGIEGGPRCWSEDARDVYIQQKVWKYKYTI